MSGESPAPPDSAIAVLMTFTSVDEAARIGAILVQERLVACINLVPTIRSLFVWDGALQDVTEVLAVAKSTLARLDAISSRVQSLHSYSVPEVIAVPILGGAAAYLDWVRISVASK